MRSPSATILLDATTNLVALDREASRRDDLGAEDRRGAPARAAAPLSISNPLGRSAVPPMVRNGTTYSRRTGRDCDGARGGDVEPRAVARRPGPALRHGPARRGRRSSPSAAMTSLTNATFLAVASMSVTSRSGRTIFRASPGNPAPAADVDQPDASGRVRSHAVAVRRSSSGTMAIASRKSRRSISSGSRIAVRLNCVLRSRRRSR